MHIVSHRTCGSSPPCTRHPIHACAPVRCVVVVSLHPSPFFLFVPLLFFRPFQMSFSEFHERLRSKPLCDFRLGTVATSDHETPLTEDELETSFVGWSSCSHIIGGKRRRRCKTRLNALGCRCHAVTGVFAVPCPTTWSVRRGYR